MFYDWILQDFKLSDSDVLTVFPYGSRVYGTAKYNSDHDFIVVLKDGAQDRDSLESSYHNINVTIYSETSFQDKLNKHKISALECISVTDELLLKNKKKFNFKLDKNTLRESISEKASHSWVKSKKKFEVVQDRDVYIAKKSLFHSLRIIDFGIQIAKNQKIINFDSCNPIWAEISSNESEDWAAYKDKYQSYFNSQMTEFRKLAPKK